MSVGFIYSENLIRELDKNVKIEGRSEMVFSLIKSYGLFENKNLKLINPVKSDDKHLKLFHSQEYIDYLKTCQIEYVESEDDFGIGYDCPYIEKIHDYVSTVAGASLTAAHLINQDMFKYVINWNGGWHHAKRDKASGFCYVNDVVLCIMKLRQKFSRILYIDLDQHHGDGVQEAFEFTNKVLTLSFHKYMPGFFPGTGSLEDIGKGIGKFYSVNVPLKTGIGDKNYVLMFSSIFSKIISVYKPETLVVQCGADSLTGDPIDISNPFNLTLEGYTKCIEMVIHTQLPTVFLGGGGYHLANSSRLWCHLTALIMAEKLKNDIPEHEMFLRYAPDYELCIEAGKVRDKNSLEYLDKTLNTILNNLNNIKID
ncbi:histone deacetylase 8-like [Brachionus plicatilis]|uniref:Histone deacetylase 8 n=1 Tax=Brachionus plicatilis TaxID=10195 RepID=A0A3M7SI48_BRAPC|nr:histone deacetylase 8-like [Brachionus plicatilis]